MRTLIVSHHPLLLKDWLCFVCLGSVNQSLYHNCNFLSISGIYSTLLYRQLFSQNSICTYVYPENDAQTNYGDIEFGFFPDVAPKTVEHIFKLVRLGCYNTNHFFRVLLSNSLCSIYFAYACKRDQDWFLFYINQFSSRILSFAHTEVLKGILQTNNSPNKTKNCTFVTYTLSCTPHSYLFSIFFFLNEVYEGR